VTVTVGNRLQSYFAVSFYQKQMREKMREALMLDQREKWLPRRWFMKQQSYGDGGGGNGLAAAG
jgi:hypothetical protein